MVKIINYHPIFRGGGTDNILGPHLTEAVEHDSFISLLGSVFVFSDVLYIRGLPPAKRAYNYWEGQSVNLIHYRILIGPVISGTSPYISGTSPYILPQRPKILSNTLGAV